MTKNKKYNLFDCIWYFERLGQKSLKKIRSIWKKDFVEFIKIQHTFETFYLKILTKNFIIDKEN